MTEREELFRRAPRQPVNLGMLSLAVVAGCLLVACQSKTSGTCKSANTLLLRLKCKEGLPGANRTFATAIEVARLDELGMRVPGADIKETFDVDCDRTANNYEVRFGSVYTSGGRYSVRVTPTFGGIERIENGVADVVSLKEKCTTFDVELRAPSEVGAGGAGGDGDSVDAGGGGGNGNPLGRGAACSNAAECLSGFCTDGRCCDSACGETCFACDLESAPGLCTPVPEGKMGRKDKACADEGISSCGTSGLCDGKGGCARYPEGAVCVPGKCEVDGFVGRKECRGGLCQDLAYACEPFACSPTGDACLSICESTAQCSGTNVCANKSCGTLPNGRECTGDQACTSGHCEDGICCDSSCDGACKACNLAGSLGVCTNVSKGIDDPHDVCKKTLTVTCGQTGTCDGDGKCELYAAGTECKAGTCNGTAEVKPSTCNGQGDCVSAGEVQCPPAKCISNACVLVCKSDGDCIAPSRCGADGRCGKSGKGVTCQSNDQCQSGHCSDKVCCDTACGGICESCNGAGNCVPDSVGTLPTVSDCAPAVCSGNLFTPASSCDGRRACTSPNQDTCGAFLCNNSGCRKSCSRDGDCAAGAYCTQTKCETKKGAGQTCGGPGECSSGNCVDDRCCSASTCGTCTRCGQSGSCEAVVNQVWKNDCAANQICLGANQCADVCTFPDPVLDKWVRDKIGKASGPIFPNDVKDIFQIQIEDGYAALRSLDGLECFPLIYFVYVSGTNLVDIDVIPKLKHLVEIGLYNNDISDISGLAGGGVEIGFDLSGNKITDLSPLTSFSFSDLTQPGSLNLSGNNYPCDAEQTAVLRQIEGGLLPDVLVSDCDI